MKDIVSGRLTQMGGDEVETVLRALVRRATRAVLQLVAKDNLEALVLAGGFGRGEGGIRVDERGERPANNLDLILFTKGLSAPERTRMTRAVNDALETLRRQSGMGIDFSAVDARRMERDRVRLLWYDVRHGHKLLAGNPQFLAGLTRFTVDNIDPVEMADLVINRGALLVLNDLILTQGPLTAVRREAILTHTAKAVIGYGDALLFFQSGYDWSYVTRRRRMTSPSVQATPEMKALYELAMTYRFSGDPTAGQRLVDYAAQGHLRKVLSQAHLDILRLTRGGLRQSFDGYVLKSLQNELVQMKTSFRKIARGVLTLVRGGVRGGIDSSYSARLGLSTSGEQGTVRALFPRMVYGLGSREDTRLAARLLGVRSASSNAARINWLLMWGRVFDPNLPFTLKRLELLAGVAA